MAFGAQTVAQYDVGFNVLLGPFRAQLGEAAGIYERTTGQMSTQSLRLATRQTDLAKAIERYGAESTQAARKTIALRQEMETLSTETARTAISAKDAADVAIQASVDKQKYLRAEIVRYEEVAAAAEAGGEKQAAAARLAIAAN